MRFAEVNLMPAEADEQVAAEKERLMFHELTQSSSSRLHTKLLSPLIDLLY